MFVTTMHKYLRTFIAASIALAGTITLAQNSTQPSTAAGQPSSTVTDDGCTIEKFTVHSSAMNRDINALVVLPPEYTQKSDARYPVLYTLHGMNAAYTSYSEMIPLRRTLATHPMLIASFDGDKAGWYIDSTKMPTSQFATFFFKEFIPYIDGHYRTKAEAASRGITGFSMGGYGAFHFMLMHPDMFASVSALSGAFGRFGPPTDSKPREVLVKLLGPYEQNQADYAKCDIYTGLQEAFDKGVHLPPMFFRAGTEDFTLADSQKMLNFLQDQNQKLIQQGKPTQVFYFGEAPGKHAWPLWRDSSELVADFHWRSFEPPFKAPAPAANVDGMQQPATSPLPADAPPAH